MPQNEDAASEIGDQFQVCESHRALANIYQSKGDIKKAIHHFVGTVSCFGCITNWRGCFVMKKGSMTHMLTSNTPSRTRPIAITAVAFNDRQAG